MKTEDLIGAADNELVNGEKIVYEYDDAGNVTAWHKEVATISDKVQDGKEG